jgi:large subunit ribosomal protein L35
LFAAAGLEEAAMAGCNKKRGNKPKMKTNRAAAKRFTVTGTGKVKFGSKGHRHCLSNKTRKHKRQQRKANYLSAGDMKLVSRLIPYML